MPDAVIPATAPASGGRAPSAGSVPAPRAAGWRELGSDEELTELLGEPHPIVIDKVHDELTEDDLGILARSPFCVLSTSDAEGNCDSSPRGDTMGFVHVLDTRTVALPDRPGNRRGDSLRNILANPRVGLLHLVPGGADVLRVNGRARILTDAPFFDAMSVGGRRPTLAVVVEIDEIFRHCPASLRRAGLWQPETWPQDVPRG
ncbi:MSMEG_1061 family FMN-dependent PPOX-type flavoprotein [Streptomyces sp. NPDC050703]|uniref:MSMEG_1061 family FMN-dependent PPOX-type flavoprotein n=1 Tax=Streptomyces sp. NPDC050703 TaxID=3157218 RepID=UPI003413DBA7